MVRRTQKGLSRKEFLKLGGAGLAGATFWASRAAAGASKVGAGRQVLHGHRGDDRPGEGQHRDPGRQVSARSTRSTPWSARRYRRTRCATVIQTRLQSDEPPDVFSYDTGPGFAGVLADAGLLRPLEDAYKKNGWDIYDWAKQRATYNGTVSGVPDAGRGDRSSTTTRASCPRCRRPWTSFGRSPTTSRGRTRHRSRFGDQEQWPAGHLFSIGVSNMLGREGLDDIFYGDGRWDTPEVECGHRPLLQGLRRERLLSRRCKCHHLRRRQRVVLLRRGGHEPHRHVARVYSSRVGTGLRSRFLPVPLHRRLRHLSARRGWEPAYFVPKKAKNPEGAITFIDYIQQDDTSA